MKEINASAFKARCLSMLRRVSRTRETGPTIEAHATYPQHRLKGTVTVPGDIVAPISEDHWADNADACSTEPATPTEP